MQKLKAKRPKSTMTDIPIETHRHHHGHPGRVNGSWYLNRSVNIGHIIATLLVVVSLIGWASKLERDIDRNAHAIEFMESRSDERVSDIKMQLDKINQKLDRLIERERQ